jgi:hypothetical protein
MILAPMLDGRPSLVLEFDEHRAEAGLVTRLEAFLDEIEGSRNLPAPNAALETNDRAEKPEDPARAQGAPGQPGVQSFVIPYFSDHAYAYSGALRAARRARVARCSSTSGRQFPVS